MKHFSLICYAHTICYDQLILPLLRRMINLEQLTLFVSIVRTDKNYIDGIQLHDDILIHMAQLKKFTFNIVTNIIKKNVDLILSSNQTIQHSFIQRQYEQVVSYIEDYPGETANQSHLCSLPYEFSSRCHIHSLPYTFDSFYYLTNSFPGGIFHHVQWLLMTDLRSFEHQFFQIISQSFPHLKQLIIVNMEPQQEKQQLRTLIRFSQLRCLRLDCAHVDYAEQFLGQYCHLPRLLNLNITYDSLMLVTKNFTNDVTRSTCAQVTDLRIRQPFVAPQNFHQYFPLL